jgi:hypothetical protein
MQSLKIIPVAFTARDFSDFESVLSLASSRLTARWILGKPAETGDFQLVSVDRPEDFAAFLRDSPALDPWRVIAYVGNGSKVAAQWMLDRREGSPPRLSELAGLLNAIDRHFNPAPTGSAPPLDLASPAIAGLESPDLGRLEDVSPLSPPDDAMDGAGAPEVCEAVGEPAFAAMTLEQVRQQDWSKPTAYPPGFSAKESFLELLQQDLKDHASQLHSVGDDHLILVSPVEGQCYYQSDLEADLLAYRSSLERIKTKAPLRDRLPKYVRRFAFTSAPLAELVWLAALIDSQASLLPELPPATPVRLSSVSVLRSLPHFHDFSGLAAFWMAGFLSLEQACLKSGEPMGKVVAFYNAAHLLKLFEAEPRAEKSASGGEAASDQAVPPMTLLEKIGRVFARRKE